MVVLLAVSLLASCVTTRVHLFTEGMSEEEVASLEQLLGDQGFEVVKNSLPIPEGMISPSIVYSPLHRNLQDVEQLRELLAENEVYVDLEPVSRSNHFYTGENVGLYPTEFVSGRKRQLTLMGKELFGECPEVDATLNLKPNLTFAAQFFTWDENTQSEVIVSQEGSWRQYQNDLILSWSGNELLYAVSNISAKTDYAKIDGIKLIRKGHDYFEACDFVYREMDPW